jgi:formylglycine-generating enzyme required for sulfatase activity
VIFVTWHAAVAFCAWLSKKEGKKYRLPTEAEWEYSCRAGKSRARYVFGPEAAPLDSYSWHLRNSGGKTHPVAKLRENDWGLSDMVGNVWELCQDWYDPNYYKTSPREDPHGPATGSMRVVRGPSWGSGLEYHHSARRVAVRPEDCHAHFGFRVVLEPSSSD